MRGMRVLSEPQNRSGCLASDSDPEARD
jgi:hypothetical protein